MNNPFQPPKCSLQGVWPLVSLNNPVLSFDVFGLKDALATQFDALCTASAVGELSFIIPYSPVAHHIPPTPTLIDLLTDFDGEHSFPHPDILDFVTPVPSKAPLWVSILKTASQAQSAYMGILSKLYDKGGFKRRIPSYAEYCPLGPDFRKRIPPRK